MNKLPILLSIPHGGIRQPSELEGHLSVTNKDLFDDSDPFVVELYDLGDKVQRVIKTDIARAFVDLNRSLQDMPPDNPDGLIKSKTCYDKPIYTNGKEPNDSLKTMLIELYYRPYHQAIQKSIDELDLKLCLDCHSMASTAPYFSPDKNTTEVMSELIGYTYTFPKEDKRSFLRDGREYSTMLNSCGRINRSGVGMAICMGDRNQVLTEGEGILTDYRKKIKEYMNILSNERWRISENENCIMVNGEDIVPETMTGTISSLIAGSPKNIGKIVILRTRGEGNTIKFSSRKSFGCKSKINLSELMRTGAEKFDGIGGGHNAAAGAKITKDKLDEFLKYLELNVVNVSSSSDHQ